MHDEDSKKEFESRKNKLIEIMDANRLEGILIFSTMLRKENIRYFTGFNPLEPGASALFRKNGESLLVVHTLEEGERAEDSFVETCILNDSAHHETTSSIKKYGIKKRLGIIGWEYIPARLVIEIRRACPNLALADVTHAASEIRLIKTGSEIRRIGQAAKIADTAFESLLQSLRPGLREYEIIAQTEYEIRRSNGEDNFQLLASGKGESRAMHPPSKRRLQSGDLFLTEISPQYEGYFAQICRSVVLGEISKGRQQAFEILFEAQDQAIKRVRPGMTASELAKIQNDVFRREGFGEFVTEKYTRGRGHGIGLYIDEEPLIAEGNNTVLEEGMVIMIHPNTYLPISGYIVLGDPVLITGKGGKRLSSSDRRLSSVS